MWVPHQCDYDTMWHEWYVYFNSKYIIHIIYISWNHIRNTLIEIRSLGIIKGYFVYKKTPEIVNRHLK